MEHSYKLTSEINVSLIYRAFLISDDIVAF
jgi:hypothetical protein